MIIVEGPDGAGKTTLCEMLLRNKVVDKVLPSPRIIANRHPEKLKHETDRYIRLYGKNNRIAVDRLLFSEMAYGPVIRGTTAFSRNEYLNHLLELSLSGSIIIFCLPDKLKYKPDESTEYIERMGSIISRYRTLAEDSAFSNSKTYIYKWDEEQAYKKLIDFIKENR